MAVGTPLPEEIEEAARKARAHDFIAEFPDGYKTKVGPNGFRPLWWSKAANRSCSSILKER